MKNKPRMTITLKQGKFHLSDKNLVETPGYQVTRLTNSVEFDIGQVIDKDEAERLSESPVWTAIIK